MSAKFKIIIKRVLEEEYEMDLENDSLMGAFDEARKLVTDRNEKTRIGRYFVTKITEVKDE
jgi:uncharacterized protein YktA (UPF0223 family)